MNPTTTVAWSRTEYEKSAGFRLRPKPSRSGSNAKARFGKIGSRPPRPGAAAQAVHQHHDRPVRRPLDQIVHAMPCDLDEAAVTSARSS